MMSFVKLKVVDIKSATECSSKAKSSEGEYGIWFGVNDVTVKFHRSDDGQIGGAR